MFTKKKQLLAEKDNTSTPDASRKVIKFSAFLTQNDQLTLVEKDMDQGFKFPVVRHRLSGGEQRGTLVVGTTALTFLNKDNKIVFCHPYRVINRYSTNLRGQVEYTLEISRGKTLVYTFDSVEAAQIVALIDKNSLRFEKAVSATSAEEKKKEVQLFDEEGRHHAESVPAPIVGPKTKLGDVPGLRFNVKLKKADGDQRVVAIVNEEGITLVDPSVEKGGMSTVAYQKYPFESITSTVVSGKKLCLSTASGTVELHTPDAHAFLQEINEHALRFSNRALATADLDADDTARAVANSIRLSVGNRDPQDEKDPYNHVTTHAGTTTDDYAPAVFRGLRIAWGVADADFSDEWAVTINPRRRELTPGLKGAWVVRSKTGRFLAQEVPKDALNTIIKSLQRYVSYLTENPHSLLLRLLGLYRTAGVYFLVYINPIRPNLEAVPATYDLHGSGNRVAPPTARGRVDAHLLDRDFTQDHRCVFLPYRELQKVKVQVGKDVSFLAEAGFVDYALQVTVGSFAEQALENVRRWVAGSENAGSNPAFLSPLEDEVYVLAITQWSEVGPDKGYAQTLYELAERRVFSSPDPTTADKEWEKTILADAPRGPRDILGQAQQQPPKSPRGAGAVPPLNVGGGGGGGSSGGDKSPRGGKSPRNL